MRVREGSERERERRPARALASGRGGARVGDTRVELDARAEQEHLALERRQPEGGNDALERGSVLAFRSPLPREVRGDAAELGRERALVLLEPRTHSVTVGAAYVPAGASSRLSTPSTCTRTRYVPGITSIARIVIVCVSAGR